MSKSELLIEKKNFIITSKDNILHHYDFHPKVFIHLKQGIGKRRIWSRVQGQGKKHRRPLESYQENTQEKHQAARTPNQRNRHSQAARPPLHRQIVRVLRGLKKSLPGHRVLICLIISFCDGGELFERL